MVDSEKAFAMPREPESPKINIPMSKYNPLGRDLESHNNTTAATNSIPGQFRLAAAYGMDREDQLAHPPRPVQSLNSLRSESQLHSGHIPPMPRNGHLPDLPDRPSTATPGPEQGEEHEEQAWGPAHPCFPHMNPHVPVNSAAYRSTRIIRVRRDWMVRGDLAPTYSNLYPEVLDPLLPEQEFRTIIHHLNKTLVDAFDPYSPRTWLDGFLGFVTGWLWEDMGWVQIKGRLKALEAWMEDWNRRVGRNSGARLIPLRRTGYMNLDIEIPDPHLRMVGGEDDNGEAEERERQRQRQRQESGGSAGARPEKGPLVPAPAHTHLISETDDGDGEREAEEAPRDRVR